MFVDKKSLQSTSQVNRTIINKYKQVQSKRPLSSDSSLSKSQFRLIQVIGRGGFGRVWRVEDRRSKQKLAMKEMSKQRILSKKSVLSVMNERRILESLNHPFIVNMHYAFQSKDHLYLALDHLAGGDLRFHISKHRFSEEETRFIVACVVVGLEYIHINGVIHRDIKPENLVFDKDGYVRITDFGISRPVNQDNSKDTSGTPGYMAPEAMLRQKHDVEADYFALGVITYELLIGRRPYPGRNRKEIRDAILSRQVSIKEINKNCSQDAADFANALLMRKPRLRLGANGSHELKSHKWLRDFPWQTLLTKTLSPPFVPPNGDNFSVPPEQPEDLAYVPSNDLFKGYLYDSRKASKVSVSKLYAEAVKDM